MMQCCELLHSKKVHPIIHIGSLPDIYTDIALKTDFYHILLKERTLDSDFGKLSCDYQDATVLFFSPDFPISYFTSNGSNLHNNILFSFHRNLIDRQNSEKNANNYSFFKYRQNESLHISLREREILINRLEDISDELNWGIDKYTDILIMGKIELFLNYCKRFYSRQFITRSEINKQIIRKAKKIIDESFSSSQISEAYNIFAAKYYADKLNMSSAYFEDLFKHETGMNITEYIQLRRIFLAKKQLCNTSKSISCIAKELGYPSQQYFSELFKKISGYTPDEYRNFS